MLELRPVEIERFWAKVGKTESTAECWPWTRSVNNKGYGLTSFRRGETKINALAHRVAYYLIAGWEPTELHHLCGNIRCCNPVHLLPLQVKGHRGMHRSDTCRRGHPYSPENTYYGKRNQRLCRACNALWHREKRAHALPATSRYDLGS